MAQFTNMTLTEKGLALQTKAQAGTQLKFTRVAIGDGVLDSNNLSIVTQLKNERMSVAIANLSIDNGSAIIKTNFSNKELSEDFYLRELGVFANDPEENEILYAVAYAGDKGDFLPAYNGSEVIEQAFTLSLVVGSATNVTATFAQSIYVLKAGDTMTGPLILSGDPSTDLGAATKGYIDNLIKEAVNKADPLGVCKEYYDTELPERHLWANGGTIGDESSGATGRANSDTIDLFKVLWKSANNQGQIRLYGSAEAVTAKGADAATDFAAHKKISLPDKRGRVGIGLDNMGGTSANVVANNNADILGGYGGAEDQPLTVDQMPRHAHSYEANNWPELVSRSSSGAIVAGSASGSTGFTGGNAPHNNMQPWVACNYIMRY